MTTTLTDAEKVALNAEISAFDEGIRQNIALAERLEETTRLVEQQALKVVDAMMMSFDAKKLHLEELRKIKLAVVNESSEIDAQLHKLGKTLAAYGLTDLKAFADTCERLNKLSIDGFFDRIDIKRA